MRCDLGQIGDELFIEDCESEGGDNGDSAENKRLGPNRKTRTSIDSDWPSHGRRLHHKTQLFSPKHQSVMS